MQGGCCRFWVDLTGGALAGDDLAWDALTLRQMAFAQRGGADGHRWSLVDDSHRHGRGAAFLDNRAFRRRRAREAQGGAWDVNCTAIRAGQY